MDKDLKGKLAKINSLLMLTGNKVSATIKEVNGEIVLVAIKYENCPETLIIPSGITVLKDGCCSGLPIKVAHIPKSVKVIGNACFANCSDLKEILVDVSHMKFVDKLRTSNKATILINTTQQST